MESSRSVSDGNQVSRPTAADGSPCQSTGRIPAQVFAPASATAQAEWSSASNESLFSIHIGNMSFNDRLSSMSKSGELDSTIISSPLFEFPVISTENGKKSGGEDGYGSANLGRNMSQLSDASAKSFAFPILEAEAETGAETDKNNTIKKDTNHKKQSSSLPSTTSTTSQNAKSEISEPQRSPKTPKSITPRAAQSGGPRKWFACFSCFPSSTTELP